MPTEGEVARLWAKVDVRGPTECWPWTACVAPRGYGRLAREGGGPELRAHRVAWEATHGAIPEGLCVCHSCDNRLCLNPLHLYLATRAEHNADRAMDGRQPRGERCCQAKLKEEQVLEIRRRVAAGESQAAVARTFPVSPSMVWKIARRLRWGWLEEGG